MRRSIGALLALFLAACTAVDYDPAQPLRCGAGSACPADLVCARGFCHPNRPPIAADDSATTPEDTALLIRVLDNDRDPDGSPLSLTGVTAPANGTAAANADGTVTYTPRRYFHGSDRFTYTVANANGLTATAAVSVTVTPVNHPPLAMDDRVTTAENTPVTIPVLANDSDPDNDPLVVTAVGTPANGSAAIDAGGTVTYTPARYFSGLDSFTYTIADPSGLTASATVFVTVTFVNQPPVAVDDAAVTAEDTPVIIAVLANDSDPEGNALLITGTTAPAHGAVVVNGDGTITYTPASLYHGADSFRYTIDDGTGLTACATVTITVTPVNHPPQANPDAYTAIEDTPLSVAAPGVLANDVDVDGDPLTAELVTGPSFGMVTLAPDGSFLYLPSTLYHGADSFTYRASDGQLSSEPATVTITVGAVNHAPVANPDAYVTDEDSPLTVAAPGVLANDTDVDGDTLIAILISPPSHGTLELHPNGSFFYQPASLYYGIDSFTYKNNDGTLDSGAAVVTITVNHVNHAPQAVDDSYAVSVGSPLVVSAPGVLGNDIDVDGDALSAVLVAGPAHGTLTFNADGSFLYTPDATFVGADSFTYQANDGHLDSNVATVAIQVDAPPVAADDAYATDENTRLDVASPGVLANDTDAEGSTLTAVLVSGPSHGTLTLATNGSFSYMPALYYYGSDSFTYAASDGVGSSNAATVTIDVHFVNQPPVAVPDAYSVSENSVLVVAAPGVLANDTDVEGSPLTAILASLPAHGTLSLGADGSFTYTPDTDYYGSDSFTYRANDGELDSAPALVTITVTPIDKPPVAVPDAYAVNENSVLSVAAPGLLSNDYDVDSPVITAVLAGPAAHGTVSVNADGSFTYTPAPGYFGADSFTYQAYDGQFLSNVATVSITVNAPPVANPDGYAVSATSVLTVAAPGVLANDTDPDGEALTASLVSGPSHGALTLRADGSFTYTPVVTYFGTDTFTYSASDGLASSAATVTITVDGRPITVNDAATVAVPLGSVNIDVLANDSDPEGEPLHLVSATTDGTQGTVTVEANNTLTYQALAGFAGRDTITYTVADSASPPNTATAVAVVVKRPVFGGALHHGVGTAPVSVALGYINLDGLTDVAVANSGSSNVSVFFQADGGVLSPSGPYAAGASPSSVAIGQLIGNNQTPLDVAVANMGTGDVTVRDGANLSGNPTTVTVGASPAAIAIADIDGSGKNDIVIVNATAGPNNVRVYFGPNFNNSTLLTAGISPSAVEVADLDGNSLLDIVVANGGSGNITVFLQAPLGTFTASTYTVGQGPSSVAIADLNGDNHVDIAVANAGSDTVSVLLQTSGGRFADAVDFPAGSTPASVAIGNLNGDGSPDLVVANRVSTGTVSILANGTVPGATRPAFAAPVAFPTGGAMPACVAIGNLTGDSKPDLAVVNRGDNELVVLPNQN
jgi:VCBS repeat-containing protein